MRHISTRDWPHFPFFLASFQVTGRLKDGTCVGQTSMTATHHPDLGSLYVNHASLGEVRLELTSM